MNRPITLSQKLRVMARLRGMGITDEKAIAAVSVEELLLNHENIPATDLRIITGLKKRSRKAGSTVTSRRGSLKKITRKRRKTIMDPAKYNISTRTDGKYAMLSLSGKAAEYYFGTDPFTVFEYGNGENATPTHTPKTPTRTRRWYPT